MDILLKNHYAWEDNNMADNEDFLDARKIDRQALVRPRCVSENLWQVLLTELSDIELTDFMKDPVNSMYIIVLLLYLCVKKTLIERGVDTDTPEDYYSDAYYERWKRLVIKYGDSLFEYNVQAFGYFMDPPLNPNELFEECFKKNLPDIVKNFDTQPLRLKRAGDSAGDLETEL
jgi:hypothetical protein